MGNGAVPGAWCMMYQDKESIVSSEKEVKVEADQYDHAQVMSS